MSSANLSLVAFSINPETGATVPNTIAPGALNSLASKTPVGDSVSVFEKVGDLTPKQLMEFKENPSVKSVMEKTGESAAEVATRIESALPRSANSLSGFISSTKNGDVMGSYDAAVRLKESTSPSVYNSIKQDVHTKAVNFGKSIKDKIDVNGDYLCKKNTAQLNGAQGFDLDRAMRAALEGAKMALSALNKCGYDTIAALDALDGDDALRFAVGLAVAEDGAENGVLDSVSNIYTRFESNILPADSAKLGMSLAKSFQPGESTLQDEPSLFKETMGDLIPNFSKSGSPERLLAMNNMKPDTLSMLSSDEDYVKDASLVHMLKQAAESAEDSITRSYGYQVV